MPSKRCLELRGTIFVSQREPKHGQRVRHNQSSPLPPVQTELGQWLRIGHYLSMRYCPRVRRRNCRCGISQIANRPNAIVISSAPAGVVGRLLATSPAATDLLPDYLSQRFIDSVLPARPRVLKVIKNVPVNSQRNKLLGIRDGRRIWRGFRGLRGYCLERRFGCLP